MRSAYLAIFLLAAILLAAALYFEHVMGLEPCPLCVLQRVVIIALGCLALAAFLQNPRGRGNRFYGILVCAVSLSGAALAVRHLYLQQLPPEQVPECGPGLAYILGNFPAMEALRLVLSGSGECAEVQWVFLGLSISGWTLLFFSGFALCGLLIALRRRPL